MPLFFSFNIYRCQYYIYKYPWVPAYQGVITFFVIANFTLATFMDPGVIPKGKGREVENSCFFFCSLTSISLYLHFINNAKYNYNAVKLAHIHLAITMESMTEFVCLKFSCVFIF